MLWFLKLVFLKRENATELIVIVFCTPLNKTWQENKTKKITPDSWYGYKGECPVRNWPTWMDGGWRGALQVPWARPETAITIDMRACCPDSVPTPFSSTSRILPKGGIFARSQTAENQARKAIHTKFSIQEERKVLKITYSGIRGIDSSLPSQVPGVTSVKQVGWQNIETGYLDNSDYCAELFWGCDQRIGHMERSAYFNEGKGRHHIMKRSTLLELNPKLTFHRSMECTLRIWEERMIPGYPRNF